MFKHAILCNHMLGQKKLGVEKAPKILSDYLLNNITRIDTGCSSSDFFDNLKRIYNTNKELIENKRINIGGDHSISIASGAHSLNKNKNTKFIWVDAHADINTYDSSLSKNYHGMVLSYLSGACKDNRLKFIKNNLDLKNLMYIGLRDIDDYESVVIRSSNINVIKSRQCNNNVDEVINKVMDFVKDEEVHLSFDVDSIDSSILRSTGTPVPNGLNVSSTKKILKSILNDTNVSNLDICELNLKLGNKRENDRSLDIILEIFNGSVFSKK